MSLTSNTDIISMGRGVGDIVYLGQATNTEEFAPGDLIEGGDYDLVVMGAHGHGIIGSAMMGSISRRVVRHSKKPVLVIRLPK